MKKLSILSLIFTATFLFQCTSSQIKLEPGDPPDNTDIPEFFKSSLSDIDSEIQNVKLGSVKTIATSPGGFPLYAVYYGEKEDFKSQANYISAIGARNPAYYAKKDSTTKPVVYFVGPVHGQEIEGIVGMLNLIHIAETGKDYRGKDWTSLQNKIMKCRTIIIPCGNPDGRNRCPYNSFVGLPFETMVKYGQGTRKDGSLWGWPQAKALHPMKGNVGILGAYFNDDGINIMDDDFFKPMAKETEAIMEIARVEAPDITVSLHSHENKSIILQSAYLAMFMKKRVYELGQNLNKRFEDEGLPFRTKEELWTPKPDDEEFPPKGVFCLTSALHHVSGTMAFTFECSDGTITGSSADTMVNYNEILDIELSLYDEMFDYILANRLYWDRKTD